MQQRRYKSCYSKQTGHYDLIIRINIIRSDSLDVCTCGGLYCSAEPLPMGFTLPYTRLTFKRLRPLSCQRLWPPATLTTWIGLLYMRLTDPLEFWDAVLTWILISIIYTTNHHEISPRDLWNYAYHIQISCLSYHNHHLYFTHPILMPHFHHPIVPSHTLIQSCHFHFIPIQ